MEGQIAGAVLSGPLPRITPSAAAVVVDLASVTVIVLAFLAIPLTIGLAVLRHRLWNVEVVVNRALTACVVAIYVLVVGGLVGSTPMRLRQR